MFENRSISMEKMVSQILRTGDIREGRGISTDHRQRIQAEFELLRPDSYQFEKPINFHYDKSKVNLHLFDTIDAVHESGDRIEMFAFTTEPEGSFIPELELLTLARIKLIALSYLLKYEKENLTVGIYWYRFDSMVPTEFLIEYTPDQLIGDVEAYILTYLEWARPFQGWKAIRDSSIELLQFPFSPYRTGQREMMAHVFTAGKRREQRLIEAPTGIGKTMASLFPAIKTLENGPTHRIFYLTARNTGHAVARNAVEILLKEEGLRLKTVIIRSKEKSCIRHDAIRECDDCKYSKGYYSRLKDGLHQAFKKDLITPELLNTIGTEFLLCPFELSLDLALHADLIICDYNYVFDPNVVLKRFFAEIEENYLFLIDEVHNLVDRGRSMYSATISREMMVALYHRLGRSMLDLENQLKVVIDILNTYKAVALENDGTKADSTPPYDLIKQCRILVRIIDEWLALKEKRKFKKMILDSYFEIRHFCNMAEQFDETYCAVYTAAQDECAATLFNVDPSPHIGKRLKWSSSALLFSATVSPHSYFKAVLGMDSHAGSISLPSPFPEENLKLLIADPVSTKLAHREVTQNEVAGAIETVVNARNGNYMAFFPSYDYMNRIADLYQKRNRTATVIVQKPGMTDQEREEYLSNFDQWRSGSGETLLGFAVMGGIFGEGVDLVGDRLNGVIVIGVGLPGLSPEREQIRTYFNHQGEGFDFAYTYPGMIKVLQAAGRVIRTESDRGIVLLIDERFATENYRRLFPEHWSPELVRTREEIIDAVHRFYSTSPELLTHGSNVSKH